MGNAPESKNVELVKLADSTVSSIVVEGESGLYLKRSFNQPQTAEAMKKFLISTLINERQAALDNYPEGDRAILPTVVLLIRTDPSLRVLIAATKRFKSNHETIIPLFPIPRTA